MLDQIINVLDRFKNPFRIDRNATCWRYPDSVLFFVGVLKVIERFFDTEGYDALVVLYALVRAPIKWQGVDAFLANQ